MQLGLSRAQSASDGSMYMAPVYAFVLNSCDCRLNSTYKYITHPMLHNRKIMDVVQSDGIRLESFNGLKDGFEHNVAAGGSFLLN
jgi:hypothetical protein